MTPDTLSFCLPPSLPPYLGIAVGVAGVGEGGSQIRLAGCVYKGEAGGREGGREGGVSEWVGVNLRGGSGGREGGREDAPVAVGVATRTLEKDVVEVGEGGLEPQGLRSHGREGKGGVRKEGEMEGGKEGGKEGGLAHLKRVLDGVLLLAPAPRRVELT